MEFKFNINDIFKQPVVEINHSLIPPGIGGDRRTMWDIVNKVTEVVNAMGEASANAQALTKPITTAERLRNSEQKLYFLIDQNANNGKGAVTGMLKTGSKGLYVFDKDGQHYQVSPLCVLDFYIHESRQRTGLGKKLFEHMLEKEKITPVQMAIDRPSEKFLGFLNKHYALNSPVKQMNNYVVFDGFFPKRQEDNNPVETSKIITPVKKDSANGLQTYTSPVGRYGAHRPPCSMGQIIHNQTSTINNRQEPAGAQIASHNVQNDVDPCPVKLERPRSLTIQPTEEPAEETVSIVPETEVSEDEIGVGKINLEDENVEENTKATPQEVPPGSEEDLPSARKTPSHLTDQGYFDLKFYHNKLW